jgi:hypothetical protein
MNAPDRDAVMRRISEIQADSTRAWGRMSPAGMLSHLTDSFRACLGDRAASDHSTLAGRTVMRFVATTLPYPWPKGVPTLAEVDQEQGGTPPGEIETELARLRDSVDDFVERIDPGTMRHPLFGRMTRAQWGRWGYRHIDHHARQFGL